MSAVLILTSEQLTEELSKLRNCLKSLPETIPYSNQFYNFSCFGADPDEVEDYGLVGAVNHVLKVTFCPGGRKDGITFKERGPGLEAVVDVLDDYNRAVPGDAVLQKWVFDLIEAGLKAGGTICPIDPQLLPANDKKRKDGGNDIKTDPPDQKKKKLLRASSSLMDRLIDVDRNELREKKGKGGRPQDPLINSIVVPCRKKGDPSKQLFFRCIGSHRGCEKLWKEKNGWKERFFTHAAACSRVPDDLRAQVNTALGRVSLGNKLTGTQSQDSFGTTGPTTGLPAVSKYSNHAKQSATVNSLESQAKKAGRVEFRDKVNHGILKLICVRGIPPTIIDSKEWKDFLNVASPQYCCTSSKTFVTSLIPRESAFVKEQQTAHLKGSQNLTLSFDGGTTAAQQSIYTVHVTTPARRTFLMDGNEASDQSHTREHLFIVLDSVLTNIGAKNFRGITSDNTGNTSVARRKVQEKYPWIIILPDPCHRLNLLCKDIAKIEYFKPVIKDVQRSVKFFRKSTQAVTDLKKKRAELGIKIGIKSIGKTRFGTVFFSAHSLLANYPAISELVKSKRFTVPDVNNIFTGGRAASNFQCGLQELITVLAPVAKSITCLESAHSTVADVYVFFLAVAAETHRILEEQDLEESIKSQIRGAVNHRFHQMIDEAPSDVYITGFILDPRYRGADIHRELNPNIIRKLKIPARNNPGKASEGKQKAEELPAPLRRAGTFLLQMLRNQYDHLQESIAGLSKKQANGLLKDQLLSYIRGDYPFNRPFKSADHAGNWWKKIDKTELEDAQPLAYLARSLFELLPNSMADERTASTMNWFNSRLRNKQDASTIVRLTTVRQFYLNPIEGDPKPLRPTVRFRDMQETIFGQKAKEPCNEGTKDIPSQVEGVAEEERDDDELGDDLDDIDMDLTANCEQDGGGIEFSSNKLDIEEAINLKAPVLLDLLADEDRAKEIKEAMDKGKGKAKEVPVFNTNDLEMDVDDEEMWCM